MIKIIEIQPDNDYAIQLWFNDGTNKIVDFSGELDISPLTQPLKDIVFFKQAKIYKNGRGIYWPNEYDVCPDYLRYHAQAVRKTHS
jgi:hypothetical protein